MLNPCEFEAEVDVFVDEEEDANSWANASFPVCFNEGLDWVAGDGVRLMVGGMGLSEVDDDDDLAR